MLFLCRLHTASNCLAVAAFYSKSRCQQCIKICYVLCKAYIKINRVGVQLSTKCMLGVLQVRAYHSGSHMSIRIAASHCHFSPWMAGCSAGSPVSLRDSCCGSRCQSVLSTRHNSMNNNLRYYLVLNHQCEVVALSNKSNHHFTKSTWVIFM